MGDDPMPARHAGRWRLANSIASPCPQASDRRPHAKRNGRTRTGKGAGAHPPVETGGLLIGPLCVCPETDEMFAVVIDVLEATDSEATKYSLSYSGPTWARIQNILRARKANPATCHHRILGQAHAPSAGRFPPRRSRRLSREPPSTPRAPDSRLIGTLG